MPVGGHVDPLHRRPRRARRDRSQKSVSGPPGRARLRWAGPSRRPSEPGATTAPPPGPQVTWCSGCIPQPGRGATSAPTGCNPRSWGAAVAPASFRGPSLESSAALGGPGGEPAGEFFAALLHAWMLTCEQRARLTPAVEDRAGQRMDACRAGRVHRRQHQGVRNRFAVLTARLSPAGLPAPPGRRPARPPRCGQCHHATQMPGFDGDAPRPRPRCKPAAPASRASPDTPLACARTGSTAPPPHCSHRV
jgi:hypothetical protein